MNKLYYCIMVSAVIVFLLTPVLKRIAFKHGFLDEPRDKRRVHKKPIPLLGGVGIYFSTVICILIFVGLSREIIGLIIGSTIILISGLIDDKWDLSPKKKMLFQIVAAIVLIMTDTKIEFFTNPFNFGESVIFLKFLSVPVTIFWVVGITNTVNLIDGLDGLAAGVSMISSISLMFIAKKLGFEDVSLIAAIIAGSCLGFLPHNFNPATIFMGDAGALFLGFVLSYITIEGIMKSAAMLTIFVPVIILGVPVFDTTFAMIRRKLNGKSMVSADKGHLHHRLLAMGLSQRQTVLILYSISVIFGLLAYTIAGLDSKVGLFMSVLIFIAVLILAMAFGMFKPKEE
ncbi:undecaprenyl-phosphate N-acetylglucosaminyl 1-phosphate transferase [Peptoniphilus sp. ING2-D1G]|nr:undecaprenyl-phosphate N-acetylglucosaminyl 1-phosphate transferase [Peptoniphilus sp. ING2-D1G]